MKINAVVLAAGAGTRMKSRYPKVIHNVLDKPMILHVIDNLKKANVSDIISVIGFQSEMVKDVVLDKSKYVYQTEQLGTGHAVMMAKELLEDVDGITIVICGDTPLISSSTIEQLIKYHVEKENKATILTGSLEDALSYGRIIRDKDDNVQAIVECKDATPQQLRISEFNTGTYIFDNKELFKALSLIGNSNAQNEYYLTDVISIMYENNLKVDGLILHDLEQTIGINDRKTLSFAALMLQTRINEFHMCNGVTIVDPKNTYIGNDVTIGMDTIIYPNTMIYGNTVIGEDCYIGPDTYIENSVIGDHNSIEFSHITDTEIKNNVKIGPFARMRANVVIEDDCKIGNFVEFKSTTFSKGSKSAHLSYIGDATVGKNTNVGCGVITVNYDGAKKHQTIVGNDCFLGCNANLIAPVNIGDGSFIAAGTTVTDNVPVDSLAIGRKRQINKEGYFSKEK
ncbi:bifunctional UDP-N-acetylglucosamine diphosphorylase/glucosamine-1-phosphate N-acetyltransferase GlmU [Mycoplasma sp. P36-A1]|uniref:bifunctional UDP-N-acetylglucosamine diphosphorylase/glucosamine-1-phosphate N-acetyltransferase GlmU n=1 Tax=Mycoplasma sp. P36-A1 TaxID=3252900 RepID=UPI003C30CEB4